MIDRFRQGVTLGVFFGSGKGASALTHENNGLGNSPLLVMARLNHQVGSGHSAKSAGGLLLLFLRLPVEERALAVRRKSYSNIWLKSSWSMPWVLLKPKKTGDLTVKLCTFS